ncbi:MAG: MutS-related protein [Lachnospiraceae bacterium]
MKEKYEDAIRINEAVADKNKRRANLVGYLKLILFVLFVMAIYYAVKNAVSLIYPTLVLILFLIQIAAWLYHARLNEIIRHAEGMIEINQRHIMRITGDWTDFADTGEEFLDREHSYGADLDISGKKSLFQFLNVTHTWYGRQALADDLLNSRYSREEIAGRQKAVEELSQNTELINELEFYFTQAGMSSDLPALVKSFENSRPFIRSRALCLLLTYLPVLTVIIGGIALIFRQEMLYQPTAVLLAAQIVLWLGGTAATQKQLRGISSLPGKFGAFHEVIELVTKAGFKTAELRGIQTVLGGTDHSAVQAFRQLAKIAEKVNIRNNVFCYLTLNPLLLWDLECAISFSTWKQDYGHACASWFEALGKLESLMSLSVLPNALSQTCFPEFTDTRSAAASELGHPLLGNAERVTNDLQLKDQILIISGSNMSGKTTYLRTVGINIVLARAGAPVCAKSMRCSDLHLVTSMRIADDLNEGISTFYAELKRIKMILGTAGKDQGTLFLIDEIFRGTNSADRLAGARAVIQKLSKLRVMGMVTTHDLELCELEQQISNVRNFNFSENYQNGKICFDYKMRVGKSKTTNGRYLMELVGIFDN